MILGGHPLAGVARVDVLERTVWIGNLRAVIVVDLCASKCFRIGERGGVASHRERARTSERRYSGGDDAAGQTFQHELSCGRWYVSLLQRSCRRKPPCRHEVGTLAYRKCARMKRFWRVRRRARARAR